MILIAILRNRNHVSPARILYHINLTQGKSRLSTSRIETLLSIREQTFRLLRESRVTDPENVRFLEAELIFGRKLGAPPSPGS